MTGLDVYNNDNLQIVLNYIQEHPQVKGFYGYLRTDKSLTTIYHYVKNAQRMLDYVKKNPSDLTFDDYTEYLSYISVKSDGTAVTSSYMIQQYHSLKNYSLYLFETGVSSKHYMQAVKRPKPIESQKTIEKRNNSYLTKEEIKIYLNAVKNGVGTDKAKACQKKMKARDYAIIMVFLTTGIRESALIKLDVNSINHQNRTLIVTDKGSKVKTYMLNDVAYKAICEWIIYRNIMFSNTDEDALFLSQYGLRLKRAGLTDIVTKYAVDINGKHITPHKLRATYGTQLYEATRDIYFVQKAMGHSSPATTERYVRGQNDVTKEASDIMGNLF